ncbi:MAG: 4-(cytidine 5'-diphospho)-2-C-methyl-D-erythritol kinase [Paludibacter sp.]|nr:4-(cytidine 5'-diphospho)-2-C-methyl-D-erythritol kinase [Paludibacter sp.]
MKNFPNAKINIGLNIIERRADGYHNIETVFYPACLHDVLEISPSLQGGVTEDYLFFQNGIPATDDTENNLIIKALRLLKEDFAIPPVEIAIEKNIPTGAGLGGGSADAAFTLKMLNEIFNLRLTNNQLESYAARLGADCPVFIRNKPIFATGTGNIFSPVNISLKEYYLLLVKPNIYVSTPAAYAQVTPCKPEKSISELLKNPIESWKTLIFNDFEKSVFRQFPVIDKIKTQIYELGAVYASMSGSGSAVYGIFAYPPPLPDFQDCFVWKGKFFI